MPANQNSANINKGNNTQFINQMSQKDAYLGLYPAPKPANLGGIQGHPYEFKDYPYPIQHQPNQNYMGKVYEDQFYQQYNDYYGYPVYHYHNSYPLNFNNYQYDPRNDWNNKAQSVKKGYWNAHLDDKNPSYAYDNNYNYNCNEQLHPSKERDQMNNEELIYPKFSPYPNHQTSSKSKKINKNYSPWGITHELEKIPLISEKSRKFCNEYTDIPEIKDQGSNDQKDAKTEQENELPYITANSTGFCFFYL